MSDEWKQKHTTCEIRWYEDQAELFEYIGSEDYENPDTGVCFAFEVIKSGDDSYDVGLYFNDYVLYGGIVEASIPRLEMQVANPEVSKPKVWAYHQYTDNGYTFM